MKTTSAKKKVRRRPHAKRIPSTGGCFGLTDELWALIEPLLPVHHNPHPLGGGRCRFFIAPLWGTTRVLTAHGLRWSNWRRHHQALAKLFHYKTRHALAYLQL